MNKLILDILACPICKGELSYRVAELELVCRFDRLAFPILNGIPLMLEERARYLQLDEM